MNHMNKKIISLAVTAAVLVLIALGSLVIWKMFEPALTENVYPVSVDFRQSLWTIEGAPAAYFGNEAEGDLNGDSQPDKAFLLTQSPGGSGTFFYVQAALKTVDGYRATNVILLGDRIAPQTTEIRDGRLLVNYADRNPGEPMTASPSLGVTKYLKIGADGKLSE